ncbi:19419_t:CDS:1, partial [Racocetra persica]
MDTQSLVTISKQSTKNTDSRLFIRQRRNMARLEVNDIYRDYH